MNARERTEILIELGKRLREPNNENVENCLTQAHHENQWFIPENSRKSIKEICDHYLDEKKLTDWVAKYDLKKSTKKKVGLVLAGNIPLVGFHDVMSTFLAGHTSIIKPSSKDKILIEMIVDELSEVSSATKMYFEVEDRLREYDAIIATGSNNTATHFEYYFKNHPNIIRKNRTSVALLDGKEKKQELQELGSDVFDYFGLGCRNVSKLFLPTEFDINRIFEAFIHFENIIHHHKYKNNYDYNEAIWLLGQEKFLTNDFLILKEEKNLYSRIASLNYEFYDDIDEVTNSILTNQDKIQCITTNMKLSELDTVSLGRCQSPSLSDFADGIDTMHFLANL